MATHTKPTTQMPQTDEQKIEHLHDMLKNFDTLLLGTYEQSGEQSGGERVVRARPMGVAKLEPDCTLYFISPIDTEKVSEAAHTHEAHVFGQAKMRFLSMRGRIEISQDRAKIRELWNAWAEVWFDGPEDPKAALMIFTPEEAELWDSGGGRGPLFLFRAARGLLGGQPPKAEDESQHARVTLNR